MSDEETEDTKLDFGLGNVVCLPSRCLRIATAPTDCDICAAACPVGAITPKPFINEEAETEESRLATTGQKTPSPKAVHEKKLGVIIGDDCIHCGLCLSVCPMESLTATKHNTKSLERQIKDKATRSEGMSVSCARSLFGVVPRLASMAISVPCLAALSAEEWFYVAAQARDAILQPAEYETDPDAPELIGSLKIYLPPLICDDCPVNCEGVAEASYGEAITQAEAWGADNIELISAPEELRYNPAGSLMDSLNDIETGDKRELVEQLANGFKQSWKNAGEDLSREKSKAEQLAKKRRKKKKQTQAFNLNTPRPFGKKSQRRRMLHETLQEDESLAAGLELLCADTVTEACVGCGACVEACSLSARRRLASNSTLYFGKLPEKKRPKGEKAAVTDQLCCLGCSACVQVCPEEACTLTWLSGTAFANLRTS